MGRSRLARTAAEPPSDEAPEPWWRSAVVYQVYLRSFADGDGDGLGDIPGLRSRLSYLTDLGVDAIWVSPWYPSPMVDAGYDVADHRAVEPRFGTLEDAEALIREAHGLGIRVLLDIVPNHTSDQHPWFQEALAAGPGSNERQHYLFREGRGDTGEEPPNDWRSVFGGPAWTRVTEGDGRPGQWYLHLFAPEQPDLNWRHPDVRADLEETLRFWFDRGVDGFRIDAAHGLLKDEAFPDVGDWEYADPSTRPESVPGEAASRHPHWDLDEVHDIYREWRAIADSYAQPRVFVGEAPVDRLERMARYLRHDELHTAFHFDFLRSPWRASALHEAIDQALTTHAGVDAPPTWVLSNHDVARLVSRYARPQTDDPGHDLSDLLGLPADEALGARRARAAALLLLALPGSAYLYQGQELGLPEVEDLPTDVLTDPVWDRSGGTKRGRDGCRVPLPWTGDEPPFGFSPDHGSSGTWLPQPLTWAAYTVDALAADPDSILNLYRRALRLRRSHPALGDGTLSWIDPSDGVVMFARDPGFVCVVNVSGAPVAVPGRAKVLLASGPVSGQREIPRDTTAWIDVGEAG